MTMAGDFVGGLILVQLFTAIVSSSVANDERLADSIRAQIALSADTPVSAIALCGAHRVFNTEAYYPKTFIDQKPVVNSTKGKCLGGRCLRGYMDIASQRANVSQLLDWGVRRMSIDLHYIPVYGLRLCRGDSHFYYGCKNLYDAIKDFIDIDVCNQFLGVQNLGPSSTGCTASSSELEKGLKEIADWLRRSATSHGQAADVLVIDIIDHVTDPLKKADLAKRQSVLGQIQDVLRKLFNDTGLIFSPAQLASFRATANSSVTEGWPTPKNLLQQYNAARVIFLADDDSSLVGDFVHARDSSVSAAGKARNAANRYDKTSCGKEADEFATVYESWKILSLEEIDEKQRHIQRVSDENGPEEVGTITSAAAQGMLACGISPSLERLTQSKILSSCVWTWAEGNKAPPSSSTDCVLVTSKGSWTSRPCDKMSLRKTCRQTNSPNNWRLSSAGQGCPSGYEFALPASPRQRFALALALQKEKVPSALLPSVAGVSMSPSTATLGPRPSGAGLSTNGCSGLLFLSLSIVRIFGKLGDQLNC